MFLPRVRLLGVCLGVVVSRYSLYVSAIETGSIMCFAENDSHCSRMGGGNRGRIKDAKFVFVCFCPASCGLGDEGEGDGDEERWKEKRKREIAIWEGYGMTMGFSRYGFLLLALLFCCLFCVSLSPLLFTLFSLSLSFRSSLLVVGFSYKFVWIVVSSMSECFVNGGFL